jgi:polysaccharide pyruvyl transferase WcaK-like protein
MRNLVEKQSVPVKKRVVLVGGYGHRNLGDDALMLASFSILSRYTNPNEITIIVRKPAVDYKYVERFVPGCDVVGISCGQRIECDKLVYGGGTMYRAFPGVKGKSSSKVARALAACACRPRRVIRRLLDGRASLPVYPLISANRSFALGIGLGPFMNGCRGIAAAQQALSRCEYVSVRDSLSEIICHQWGMRNVVCRADLCFCRALWSNGFLSQVSPRRRARHVGVVVREWKHSDIGAAYRLPLCRAVNRLRKMGYNVKYVFFQDEPNWRRRLARTGDSVLAYSPDSTTVEQFVDKLRQFDLIITARAHGAIFASILGIPAVCIEIEPKLKHICIRLHGGSQIWPPPFDENALVAVVRDMAGSLQMYSELMCEAAGESGKLVELSISEFLAAS